MNPCRPTLVALAPGRFDWRHIPRLLAALLLLAPTFVSAQELRARLGGAMRGEMIVLGLDPEGVRLRPAGETTGEVILPLAEARDLWFVLPESYQRALQLAYYARPDEALLLLAPVVRLLVPYAAAPGTNAVPVINTYFDLLLGRERWAEALALARSLPLDTPDTGFLPRFVALARALRTTGAVLDATTLVQRVPVNDGTREWWPLLRDFADELRRTGHYVEAQTLYERLPPAGDDEVARAGRELLLAYTDYHAGQRTRAAARLEELAPPPGETEAGTLFRLLAGRRALDTERPADALDLLGRALVEASGATEWRAELMAVIARAYRAAGPTAVADGIEADLRRIYPASRWTPPAPPSLSTDDSPESSAL
jgi:hypothetical protein